MTDENTMAKSDGAGFGQRARDAATSAGKNILDSANRTGDRGLTAVGSGLERAASYVEEKFGGEEARSERVVKVVAPLHNAAQYLTERDPSSMVSDADESIHRHPYRAMGVALVAGWVLGRLMRRD